MDTAFRSFIVAVAVATALAACEREPVTQVWTGDPSLPDAATVFAKEAAEKAQASQESGASQAAAKPLTNAEESKAMPLPGQANDHSNTVSDKNKGS